MEDINARLARSGSRRWRRPGCTPRGLAEPGADSLGGIDEPQAELPSGQAVAYGDRLATMADAFAQSVQVTGRERPQPGKRPTGKANCGRPASPAAAA
jgi:hypothetical protein